MSKFKLFSEIITLSKSKEWDSAKKEWYCYQIYKTDSPQSCLCGHYPIKELCFIRNKENNNQVVVGNCCINKFFGDKGFNKMFKAFAENRLNKSLIELAYKNNIINDKEYIFAENVCRKRKPSLKQSIWFISIKKKIFEAINGNRIK